MDGGRPGSGPWPRGMDDGRPGCGPWAPFHPGRRLRHKFRRSVWRAALPTTLGNQPAAHLSRGVGARACSTGRRCACLPRAHLSPIAGVEARLRWLPHSGEWRNRQTRRIQVPVSERMWGFKSPLAHARGRRKPGPPTTATTKPPRTAGHPPVLDEAPGSATGPRDDAEAEEVRRLDAGAEVPAGVGEGLDRDQRVAPACLEARPLHEVRRRAALGCHDGAHIWP